MKFKGKMERKEKVAAFLFLDFVHSEIRHFKLLVSRSQQEEYLE